MQVVVHLDEPVWRQVGQRNVSVSLDGKDRTVADVIDALAKRFAGLDAELRGQTGDFVPYALFLNDETVRWEEIERTHVAEGDHLRVILPIAGG